MKLELIILLILFIPLAQAEMISWNNEELEITNLIMNKTNCEDENNIFKILRKNYSTGGGSVMIEYSQIWNEKEIKFSKEIKKYSQSKTGKLENLTSGNYTLIFQIKNNSLSWNINLKCEKEIMNLTNSTIKNIENNSKINNNTKKENNTNITLNNTIANLINVTLNKNNTEENTTINNESKEINIEINKTEEEKQSNKLVIKTNKELFFVGDKLEFQFVNNTEQITYWIEDIEGEIVKNKYTTDNDNTKTYTFKDQENLEKIYVLIVKNTEEEKRIILGVKNKELLEKESLIKIENAVFEENKIKLSLKIQRGESKKTTIYCYSKTNDKKSSEEYKIKINSQNQQAETTIYIYPKNKWEEETIILCEGLDIIKSKVVKTPQEKSEKLIEEKEIEILNTVKNMKEEKELKIAKIPINKENNTTKVTGSVSAYSKSFEKEKNSTIIVITALLSMIFSILIILIGGRSIDKFIKK